MPSWATAGSSVDEESLSERSVWEPDERISVQYAAEETEEY